MVTLDAEEAGLAKIALARFIQEAEAQLKGMGSYAPIWAAAWHATTYVKQQMKNLLFRIEQAEQDERDDNADA